MSKFHSINGLVRLKVCINGESIEYPRCYWACDENFLRIWIAEDNEALANAHKQTVYPISKIDYFAEFKDKDME